MQYYITKEHFFNLYNTAMNKLGLILNTPVFVLKDFNGITLTISFMDFFIWYAIIFFSAWALKKLYQALGNKDGD